MSIDENHGSLYKNLAELRQTNGKSSNNLFKAMGFDYRYVDNGNDLETVIRLFEEVKILIIRLYFTSIRKRSRLSAGNR